jgi:predicted transcriptional regulator
MDRSTPDTADEPHGQDPAADAWQSERIREGVAAAREGRTRPAEAVYHDIAAKHGWTR